MQTALLPQKGHSSETRVPHAYTESSFAEVFGNRRYKGRGEEGVPHDTTSFTSVLLREATPSETNQDPPSSKMGQLKNEIKERSTSF